MCREIVSKIERMTAMRSRKDRIELKAMSAKQKEVCDPELLEKSIAGKKKLLRAEARKVALLHELLEARFIARRGLASPK